MALKRTWIAIADQEQTRIYAVDNRDFNMTLVKEVLNSSSSRAESLKGKKDVGVGRSSVHSNVRSLVNENAVQRRLLKGYVTDVVDFIEKGRRENSFQKIILVAGPEMMGMIKSKLTKPTMSLVQRALTKDYTRFKECEVQDVLHNDLRKSFLSA